MKKKLGRLIFIVAIFLVFSGCAAINGSNQGDDQNQPVQDQPVQDQPVQDQPVQEQPVQEQPVQSNVGPTRQQRLEQLQALGAMIGIDGNTDDCNND